MFSVFEEYLVLRLRLCGKIERIFTAGKDYFEKSAARGCLKKSNGALKKVYTTSLLSSLVLDRSHNTGGLDTLD